MNKEKIIEQLLALWYSCLVDHHKDRDCHFYIERRFSTYLPNMWFIRHPGYISSIGDDDEEQFNTYAEAEDRLIALLIDKIKSECKSYIAMPADEYAYAAVPIGHWHEILHKLAEFESK